MLFTMSIIQHCTFHTSEQFETLFVTCNKCCYIRRLSKSTFGPYSGPTFLVLRRSPDIKSILGHHLLFARKQFYSDRKKWRSTLAAISGGTTMFFSMSIVSRHLSLVSMWLCDTVRTQIYLRNTFTLKAFSPEYKAISPSICYMYMYGGFMRLYIIYGGYMRRYIFHMGNLSDDIY